MMELNVQLAWVWILMGMLTGAGMGLFFHREEWFGGYNSWQRRMMRLGHIAFFGTAFLNLAFAFTVSALDRVGDASLASMLLVVGAVAMPAICFLASWRKPFRHLFFIPVLSLGLGAILVCLEVLS